MRGKGGTLINFVGGSRLNESVHRSTARFKRFGKMICYHIQYSCVFITTQIISIGRWNHCASQTLSSANKRTQHFFQALVYATSPSTAKAQATFIIVLAL